MCTTFVYDKMFFARKNAVAFVVVRQASNIFFSIFEKLSMISSVHLLVHHNSIFVMIITIVQPFK